MKWLVYAKATKIVAEIGWNHPTIIKQDYDKLLASYEKEEDAIIFMNGYIGLESLILIRGIIK